MRYIVATIGARWRYFEANGRFIEDAAFVFVVFLNAQPFRHIPSSVPKLWPLARLSGCKYLRA